MIWLFYLLNVLPGEQEHQLASIFQTHLQEVLMVRYGYMLLNKEIAVNYSQTEDQEQKGH